MEEIPEKLTKYNSEWTSEGICGRFLKEFLEKIKISSYYAPFNPLPKCHTFCMRALVFLYGSAFFIDPPSSSNRGIVYGRLRFLMLFFFIFIDITGSWLIYLYHGDFQLVVGSSISDYRMYSKSYSNRFFYDIPKHVWAGSLEKHYKIQDENAW